ncbi:MAG: alpha/beta hydrolase [Azospirillaceae bacterium]
MSHISASKDAPDIEAGDRLNAPVVIAIQANGVPTIDWNALRSLAGGGFFNFRVELNPLLDGVAPESARRFTLDNEIARISTLARCLGRSLHVVGIGVACPVAFAVARSNPDIVRSLVLIEPLILSVIDPTDALERAFLDAHHDVTQACAQFILEGRVAEASERFRVFAGGAFDPHRDPDHRETMARYIVPAIHGSVAAARHRLTPADLAGVTMPTKIVIGELAAPLLRHIALKLLGLLPAASLVRVDGAGFLPLLTHPNTVLSAVNGHVSHAQFPVSQPTPAALDR